MKLIPDFNLTRLAHVYEYFIAAMLFSWSISFVIDENMYSLYTYTYLNQFGSPYFWSVIFLFLGAVIITGINKTCAKWRSYVGISLCISGFLWTLISVGFVLTYPPYSSVMLTYPVLSVFSYLTGFRVLDESKKCRRGDNGRL